MEGASDCTHTKTCSTKHRCLAVRPQQPAEVMQTTNSPTPPLLVVGSTRFTTPASQQRPRGRRPKELRPRLLSLFCTWVISRRMASRQCGEFDGLPGGSGMDLLHHRHKHRLLGVQVGVRVGFTSPLLVSCAVVVVFIVVLVVLVLVCIDVTAAWGSVATAGIARPHPTPQLRIVIAIVLRPRCIQLLKRLSTRQQHTRHGRGGGHASTAHSGVALARPRQQHVQHGQHAELPRHHLGC